jgi:hypothetical protein
VFDSEDIVFVWAIGKALLVVIVSIGALVYIAWVATRKNEISARAEIPENGAVEGARHILSGTPAEENNTRKPDRPSVAA